MTVTTTESMVHYVADGIATVYPFYFSTLDAAWIYASVNLILDPTIVVDLNPDQEVSPGGTVTFLAPPAANDQIRIARIVPLTQETDYPPFTRFPARAHESALDKLTMIEQQQDTRLAELFQYAAELQSQILDLDAEKADKTTEILTTDADAITIVSPTLHDDVTIQPNTNVPNGLAKLDLSGKIPLSLLPAAAGLGDFMSDGSVPMTNALRMIVPSGNNARFDFYFAGLGGGALYTDGDFVSIWRLDGAGNPIGTWLTCQPSGAVALNYGNIGRIITGPDGGEINGRLTTNQPTPISPFEYASKQYVDSVAGGGGNVFTQEIFIEGIGGSLTNDSGVILQDDIGNDRGFLGVSNDTEIVIRADGGRNIDLQTSGVATVNGNPILTSIDVPIYMLSNTTVSKVSSTAFTNVPGLSFNAAANSTYLITGTLLVNQGAGGASFRLDSSAGGAFSGTIASPESSAGLDFLWAKMATAANPFVADFAADAFSMRHAQFNVVFVSGPSPTTVNVAFAQQVSNAAASTVMVNSSLIATRMGPAVVETTVTISANVNNLNLKTLYESTHPPAVAGETINFVIDPGVQIGGTIALRTGVWPAGVTLNLTNNSTDVVGAGGNGSGPGPGQAGGTALLAESPININNLGRFAGGGGGGAGTDVWTGGASATYQAGGGGGRGIPGGTGHTPSSAMNNSAGAAGSFASSGAGGNFGSDPNQANVCGGGLKGGNGGGFGLAGGNGQDVCQAGSTDNVGGAAGFSVSGYSLVNWISVGTLTGPTTG